MMLSRQIPSLAAMAVCLLAWTVNGLVARTSLPADDGAVAADQEPAGRPMTSHDHGPGRADAAAAHLAPSSPPAGVTDSWNVPGSGSHRRPRSAFVSPDRRGQKTGLRRREDVDRQMKRRGAADRFGKPSIYDPDLERPETALRRRQE